MDDEGADLAPASRRSRRPTVESMDQRSVSPPNSVKAFAEARKRERELSFSEPKPDRKDDDVELQRTTSALSRPHTAAAAEDAASLVTNKTAEEDVCFPLQDERHRDRDQLHIDFDFLESFIKAEKSREKIELFPSYYFACFRSFYVGTDEQTQEKEYKPFNIYVIVFREGTLSFTYASNPHASHVRKRITMLKDYVALSSDWICYALIDDIVDCFAPEISKLEQESDQIEDDVFIARTGDMARFLRKIGTARKNVMGLMRLLGGKADVLKGFTKRCNENYKVTPRMDIGLYLGDIQDHVITMMTNLGHFEKILSRAHSNYLAQLSIDSISQGTSTNRVLSKITVLASIIVPLNVVTGLFGMNVAVPWQSDNNQTLYAFYGILGGLGAFVLITLILARVYRLV
ncbi:hypothetical protein P8C59_004666 [Phyllachora maydis]|uniref:Uncharacterized protein n=1 Tax=Phyllachora maydis TaxID=1825666 RepID=A0AAD9MBI2_9PEZI|nr:hypothetical protein P8C59_004666 [Phyllachora maydis]